MREETRERLPALLSFWVPGLGQLLRREWAKGLALLACSWVTTDQAIARVCCSGSCLPFAAWTAGAVGIWWIAVFDARRRTGRA